MWEIRREDLLAGLQILDMVPVRLGIPSSEFFWMRGTGERVKMSVASYIAGEVVLTGQGKWPSDKDFFIDRRVLLPFVYAARELKNKNTFQFEIHKKQLIIRHGTRKAEFQSQSKVSGYSDLKKVLKEKRTSFPVSDSLRELLLCGRNCATSDAVLPHLNCVYIAKGTGSVAIKAYAASDKVFYLGTGKVDGDIKTSIPFPLFLIDLLRADGLKKISWMGKYIVLQFEHGLIWQPISMEALSKFPLKDIKGHAAKTDNKPIAFSASSRRFSTSMLRLSYYLQSVRRKDWVVKLVGKKGRDSIAVTTSIPGSQFLERLRTTEAVKKDFQLEWPLEILEPVFAFLSKKTKKLGMVVRLDDKRHVSYIKTGHFWLAVPSKQEE